jgi:osmotically-inducible protein OsmY
MRSPKLGWIGLACALAAGGAGVCANRQPVPPPSLSQYAPLGVSRWFYFGESPLERRIRAVLRDLPRFSVFDYVSYRVDGGRVTLYGAVMSPPLREDAAAVVEAIDGVDRVNNLIRFLPNSPQDNRIRQRVFSAVYGDRTLAPYALLGGGAIRILVERGFVVLEGQVASAADNRRAAQLASVVPGVIRVTSHLRTID